MPTGYTSQLTDKPGMSFAQFALLCSRAFGALIDIDMRDDPLDTPIPTEVKPIDYHKKALFKAWGRKGRAKQLTLRQRKAIADAATLDELRRCTQETKKSSKTLAAYRSMLAKVQAWTPPTPEHEGLKKFMIEQLESSIRLDDMSNYYASIIGKALVTDWKQWWREHQETIARDIAYHIKENEKEIARCQDRTKWIQNLMVSLGIDAKKTAVALNKISA